MNQESMGDGWVSGMSRNRLLQGYLLSGFLAVVALLFIFVLNDSSPDAQLIGFAQLFFAGIIFLLAYRNGVNSTRLLVMDSNGIWYQGWKTSAVPWNEISDVSVSGSRIKASVNVTLKDPDAWVDAKSAAEQKSIRKNPLVVMPILKIPNGHVEASLPVIVEEAQSRLN